MFATRIALSIILTACIVAAIVCVIAGPYAQIMAAKRRKPQVTFTSALNWWNLLRGREIYREDAEFWLGLYSYSLVGFVVFIACAAVVGRFLDSLL